MNNCRRSDYGTLNEDSSPIFEVQATWPRTGLWLWAEDLNKSFSLVGRYKQSINGETEIFASALAFILSTRLYPLLFSRTREPRRLGIRVVSRGH